MIYEWKCVGKHKKKHQNEVKNMIWIDNQQYIHSSKTELSNCQNCQNQKVCTLVKQWYDDLAAEDHVLNNKGCQHRHSA